MSAIDELIKDFENRFHREIKARNTLDPVDDTFEPYPSSLDPKLSRVLSEQGIPRLFAHQDAAFRSISDNLDTLLVSFNGNSFDVPRLLDHYHIPELPCPHLDLWWLCYHCGYRGGLKDIEAQLDIERPVSASGVDGADATWLWERWDIADDTAALQQLRCYCAADVLTMPAIAACILRDRGVETPEDMLRVGWDLLETVDNG
ncbi:MAG: ribonuclease H-like domain-containing protein [Lentisphaeria bacterium]